MRSTSVAIVVTHAQTTNTLNSRLRLLDAAAVFCTHSPDPPSPRRNLTSRLPIFLQVDRCFPLEQAKEGHDYLEAGKSRGKVLYEI